MCTVVNKRSASFDIYIGRGSKWGNPFVIGKDGSREEVIAKYRQYLWSQIKGGFISIQDLQALKGKRLGCYCKPLACHGDILAKAVEWANTPPWDESKVEELPTKKRMISRAEVQRQLAVLEGA